MKSKILGWLCFILSFLTGIVAVQAASGDHLWAISAGGPSDDKAEGIAVDSQGNIFIVGTYEGTANFGRTDLTSAGGKDIFIAKFNREGSLQWAQRAGGIREDDQVKSTLGLNDPEINMQFYDKDRPQMDSGITECAPSAYLTHEILEEHLTRVRKHAAST